MDTRDAWEDEEYGGCTTCKEWLGTIDDRGVVAVGKRADLLLLEGNPLQDIKNTRRIAGVVVGGKFFSRNELNYRLQLLRRN